MGELFKAISPESAYLHTVTRGLTALHTERIRLEATGADLIAKIPLNPLNDPENTNFFNRARKGLTVLVKMDQFKPDALDPEKLFKETKQVIDSIKAHDFAAVPDILIDELPELFAARKPEVERMDAKDLFAASQVVSTLSFLNMRGHVSLQDFDGALLQRLGVAAAVPTNWDIPINPERVWDVVTDLERVTRYARLSPFRDMDAQRMLFAGHFFAASEFLTWQTFPDAA